MTVLLVSDTGYLKEKKIQGPPVTFSFTSPDAVPKSYNVQETHKSYL